MSIKGEGEALKDIKLACSKLRVDASSSLRF